MGVGVKDLTAMSVRSLTVSPDDAWVYAGTDEGGVHRTPVSALVPADLLPAATSTQIKAPASGRPLEPFLVKVTVSAAVGPGDRHGGPRG